MKKKIKLPFGWIGYIFICKKEKLNEESKKIKIQFNFDNDDSHKVNGFSQFVTQPSPKPDLFLIWIRSDLEKEINYLLIHELSHLVDDYSNHIGILDGEFRAYLLEDLCRQLKLFGDKNENTYRSV